MGRVYAVAKISDATIRALNYAPELDRFRAAPKRKKAGWTQQPLGELVDDLGKAYAKVLSRVDCIDNGDELLSQADVFDSEPTGRLIRGDLMSFVEDLRVERGDILIAGAGQMGESTLFGRALIADSRLTGKLAAGDIMVLRSTQPDADRWLYTYAFLATPVGLRGIRTAAYGTSIPRMRPDLLAQLPVPLPDADVQRRVADQVRRCIAHREKYLSELTKARAIILYGVPRREVDTSWNWKSPRIRVREQRL